MNKYRGGAVVAALVLGSSAFAAVTVDEHGVGFVGKGDVQSVYDWNNAMLQANAANVRFRMASGGAATWKCEGYNGSNKYTVQNKSSESTAVSNTVGHDTRKNSQGQVTGFILTGSQSGGGSTTYATIGHCNPNNGWVVQPTLVPDSIQYDGGGEAVLEVSVNGVEWLELPITY